MLDTTSLLLTHLRSQPEDTIYYIKEKPYSAGYLIGEIENDSMFGTQALNTLIGEVINGLTERKSRPYQAQEHLSLSQMMASSDSALSIIQVLSMQTHRVISGISDRSLDSEGYNKVLRHPAIKPLVTQLNSLINP
jgi:hypothetical protein